MLVEAAKPLGFTPSVYVQDEGEPAVELASSFVVGNWEDEAALRHVFSQSELVVFENEFVDLETLRRASRLLPVRFSPPLDTFAQVQHKRDQKRWLVELGFPTTPFREFASLDEYFSDPSVSAHPHVLKWGSRGYDGKGILPVSAATARSEITAFFKEASRVGSLVFAEEKVNFIRELALVAGRSASGEKASYPLVVSAQEEGICWWVKGPATALGVNEAVEKKARDIAYRVLDALHWEGPLAIEFFQISDTEILINELAPRVHNSAHFSQDAADSSQFENQWRAALRLPLASHKTKPFFAMRNLLGPKGYTGSPDYTPHNLPVGVAFHWYGKREVRPKRKIGHINLSAGSRAELDSLCERVDKWVREWETEWEKNPKK